MTQGSKEFGSVQRFHISNFIEVLLQLYDIKKPDATARFFVT